MTSYLATCVHVGMTTAGILKLKILICFCTKDDLTLRKRLLAAPRQCVSYPHDQSCILYSHTLSTWLLPPPTRPTVLICKAHFDPVWGLAKWCVRCHVSLCCSNEDFVEPSHWKFFIFKICDEKRMLWTMYIVPTSPFEFGGVW